MKQTHKYIKDEIPVYIICVLLGVLGGFLVYTYTINHFNFKIEPTLNFDTDPFDIILTIITLYFGTYIVRKLGQKDEVEKTKKEHLVKMFDDFDTNFSENVKAMAQNGSKVVNVAGFLKRNRMRLQKLSELAVEVKLLKEDSLMLKKISEEMKIITDLLTLTPKEGEVEDGIRISGGVLSFSPLQIDKIALSIFNINCAVYKVGLEILTSRE